MAVKEFSSSQKTVDEHIADLRKLAGGAQFPVRLEVSGGKITNAQYETTWKEGSTRSVETGELDENGYPVLKYEENYTKKKLTATQTKKIDKYINDNLAES